MQIPKVWPNCPCKQNDLEHRRMLTLSLYGPSKVYCQMSTSVYSVNNYVTFTDLFPGIRV